MISTFAIGILLPTLRHGVTHRSLQFSSKPTCFCYILAESSVPIRNGQLILAEGFTPCNHDSVVWSQSDKEDGMVKKRKGYL